MEKEAALKTIEMITPESIALQMPLANFSHRFEAFTMDVLRLVLFTVLILLIIWLMIASLGIGGSAAFIILAFANILIFLLWNGYFIYYELKYGATPGKRKNGLKVVSQNGSFLPASAIYVRNILREIELWLPLRLGLLILIAGPNGFGENGVWPFLWIFMIGMVPCFDKYHRRIGDFLAGTVVIIPPQARLEGDLVKASQQKQLKAAPTDESTAPKYQFTETMVDIYGKEELQTLEEILRKAPTMQPMERKQLFKTLVEKIAKKIDYKDLVPITDYELFLNLFYEAQRARLENKLLHGQSLERRTRKWRRKKGQENKPN
jgi:uncharacterized RDD family membrane protein YckC